MMRIGLAGWVVAGWLAACGVVMGGEEGTRVGVADMARVFTNHPGTVAAEAMLKAGIEELEASMKGLIAEGREIEEEAKGLLADTRNGLLTEEARAAKRLEYEGKAAESKDFQAKVKRTYELKMKQLQEKVMREKAVIVENLLKEVGIFAKRSGYDLILDGSGLTANDLPLTVYFSEAVDVTEPLVQWIRAHGGEEAE